MYVYIYIYIYTHGDILRGRIPRPDYAAAFGSTVRHIVCATGLSQPVKNAPRYYKQTCASVDASDASLCSP